MRKLLAAAVALAPIAVAAGAHAETVISNTRTTAILTANANSGAADDVRIAQGGSIELRSGAAVTLNSNNDVTLDEGGAIGMEDAANGATAILAQGGRSGSIAVNGAVRITDGYTAQDTDGDGDLDGPFAEGRDRYGVRVTGSSPLDGDVIVGRTGAISVEGNQSYGVAVEPGLTGDLTLRGAVTVTGDQTYGVRVTGDIGGDAWVGGSIQAQGEGAVGVSLEGDIAGSLRLDSTINASGFRYNVRPTNPTALENLDPDDLLLGGSAVRIRGNVDGGVLLAGAPPTPGEDDDDDDDRDLDNDGVPDVQQTAAQITAYGSAPALQIGSSSQDVALGVVGTGGEAFGLINRGVISGQGVYDGFSATGILVGGEGGRATIIEGGVRNDNGVIARAFQANATGLHLADGAVTPRIHNMDAGLISSQVDTEGDHVATALRIDAGADMASLYNAGRIQATVTGADGGATAVRDLSGTLTDIRNIGAIQAIATPIQDEDGAVLPITSELVAIDVSANTTGVALTQLVLNVDPDNPPANGITAPVISGDIRLGSGADVVDIRDGFVIGDIDFGRGADTLRVSGDAVVRGALASADGQLSITVDGGVLDAWHETPLTISDLSVGEDGALIVTIDPASGSAGGFNVTGSADFADGASLGVRVSSLLMDPARFTLIDANSLTFGEISRAELDANSPYLLVVETTADEAAGLVYADVRRRTASEIDMIAAEAAAFDGVYNALGADDELREAFLRQTDREGFIALYEQMLPDHSGGSLVSLASGVDAVTRALAGRNNTAARGERSAWLQEINFYADRETGDAYGFKSEGFGLAGGVERGTAFGAVGISTAFTSSDLEDPRAMAEERLSASLIELGLYWRAQGQNWTTWARVAGGYASFESIRQFVGEGLIRRSEADWNGYTIAAAAGANYEHRFGRYNLRPELTVEYFGLREDSYEETGGGGFNLAIDERSGHIFSTTAALNFGMGFGENYWLRPELRVGWRHIVSHDGGITTARFRSGGPAFDLMADSLEGGGPILGLRLNVGNELGMLAVEADAELLDDYIRYALLLRASFRF